jgi:hypothetical protein
MDDQDHHSIIPDSETLRPFVVEAVEHFGYFERSAEDFLIEMTLSLTRSDREIRALLPSQVIGIKDHVKRDPLGAVETTAGRALFKFRLSEQWNRTLKSGRFLPYMRVRFCAWCPDEWASKDIVVEVAELTGHPLRHCSLPICQGFARQGTHRLLKEKALSPAKGL